MANSVSRVNRIINDECVTDETIEGISKLFAIFYYQIIVRQIFGIGQMVRWLVH